jgi:hypothetical protein
MINFRTPAHKRPDGFTNRKTILDKKLILLYIFYTFIRDTDTHGRTISLRCRTEFWGGGDRTDIFDRANIIVQLIGSRIRQGYIKQQRYRCFAVC